MRGESFLSLSVNTFPTTGFEYLSSLFIQRARTETFAPVSYTHLTLPTILRV